MEAVRAFSEKSGQQNGASAIADAPNDAAKTAGGGRWIRTIEVG